MRGEYVDLVKKVITEQENDESVAFEPDIVKGDNDLDKPLYVLHLLLVTAKDEDEEVRNEAIKILNVVSDLFDKRIKPLATAIDAKATKMDANDDKKGIPTYLQQSIKLYYDLFKKEEAEKESGVEEASSYQSGQMKPAQVMMIVQDVLRRKLGNDKTNELVDAINVELANPTH